MGNEIHFKPHKFKKCILNQVKSKALAKEIKKKISQRNILFIGGAKCGKTEMIKTIVNISNPDSLCLAEYNEYQYNLNEFVVTEYSHPSLQKHAFSSYQYLNLINQIEKAKELFFMKKKAIKKIIKSIATMKDKDIKHINDINQIIDYELLVNGYVNFNLPIDIINLLTLFCKKPMITSHKIEYIHSVNIANDVDEVNYYNNTNTLENIYNLWQIEGSQYAYYSKLLFDSIHSLIFLIDISQYDEFDANGNNKLVDAFNAFNSFYNDTENNNYLDQRWCHYDGPESDFPGGRLPESQYCEKVCKWVIFSKMNRFKHKLLNDKIAINKCPLFKDYNYDEYKNKTEGYISGYTMVTLRFMENKLKTKTNPTNRKTKTETLWFTMPVFAADIKKVIDIIFPSVRSRYRYNGCSINSKF